MPRLARLDVANIPQHVVQRGNDRQPCFFRSADYPRYLENLREAAALFDCKVHAYALMTNHVHLLLTPETSGAVGKVMQTLGRRYVRYINDSMGRSGTLWEGRYKASMVDSDRYVLACYRYIELNPVRGGMVRDPVDYPWSSFARNGYGGDDNLVHTHPAYQSLSADNEERLVRYRDFVCLGIDEKELEEIRLYTQRQRVLGSAKFQKAIEQMLGRRAGLGAPGRPRRTTKQPCPNGENVL